MLSDEVSPCTLVLVGIRRAGPARQRDELRRDGADAGSRLVDHLDQFGERLLRVTTPKSDQHSDREIDHSARRPVRLLHFVTHSCSLPAESLMFVDLTL